MLHRPEINLHWGGQPLLFLAASFLRASFVLLTLPHRELRPPSTINSRHGLHALSEACSRTVRSHLEICTSPSSKITITSTCVSHDSQRYAVHKFEADTGLIATELLYACLRSRSIALRHYEPAFESKFGAPFYISWKRDTICFTEYASLYPFIQTSTRKWYSIIVERRTKLRRLEIATLKDFIYAVPKNRLSHMDSLGENHDQNSQGSSAGHWSFTCEPSRVEVYGPNEMGGGAGKGQKLRRGW
jgi:hypothetical protein